MLGAAAFAAPPAWAVDDPDRFELDGDAATNLAGTGVDWETINLSPPAEGAVFGDCTFITASGAINDPPNATIFSGGVKDLQQISPPQAAKGANNVWAHTTGSVPDKNDLSNAYAAAFDCSGDLVIYFGADRIATAGDAFLAFWFLNEDITVNPNGTFSGRHVNGDVLVLVNFRQGGTVPNIGIFEWAEGDPTADITDGGVPVLKTIVDPSTTAIRCEPSTTTGKNVCAVTNDQSIPLFWSYTPKGGSPGDPAPPLAFFEGGINIDRVLPDTDLCISRFVAETRSSTSVSADLKDFITESFDVCGVSVTKQCEIREPGFDSGTGLFTYRLFGEVTSARGTLDTVEIWEDVDFDGEVDEEKGDFLLTTVNNVGSTPVDWTFNLDTDVNQPSDQVIAVGFVDGVEVASDVSNLVDCPFVVTEAALTVTKVCRACLALDAGLIVTILAEGEVCNTGEVNVLGVTVVDETYGEDVFIGTLGPDECQPYEIGPIRPDTVNSPDPSLAVFTDIVSASGTNQVNSETVLAAPVEATCELCPDGEDTSGIVCPPLATP